MKTLGRKMMIILASALFGFLGLWFLLATCLTIPGQGLESLKFIHTVEDEVDRIFPKGKFLVNEGITKEIQLKDSYRAEVLSTIVVDNFKDIKEDDGSLASQLLAFADQWVEDNITAENATIINDKGTAYIDLNWIGHNFVEFDKAVTRKFFSSSFVSAGIQYLYTAKNSVKNMFSKGLEDFSKTQETVMDQDAYNKSIVGGSVAGKNPQFQFTSSAYGAHIVNNKVWFLQQQYDLIIDVMGMGMMESAVLYHDENTPLPDADEYTKTTARPVLESLKQPNFTGSLKLLQAGTVMTLMTPFFAAIIIPLGTLIIVWNRKN
jgi:hypothetical protein